MRAQYQQPRSAQRLVRATVCHPSASSSSYSTGSSVCAQARSTTCHMAATPQRVQRHFVPVASACQPRVAIKHVTQPMLRSANQPVVWHPAGVVAKPGMPTVPAQQSTELPPAVMVQREQVRFHLGSDGHDGLMELPFELVQEVADWLPTFEGRAQLRALCRGARALEWRSASPFYVKEELSGFCLGDKGCAAIAAGLQRSQNAGLKELCLGCNDIADDGVEALALVLAAGSNLRRLSLRDNRIQDRGALALAGALKAGSKLEEIDLWGNCISDAGKMAIISAAKSCEVFLELPTPVAQPHSPCWNLALDANIRTVLFDWLSQVHESVAATVESASDPQNVLLRAYSHLDAYLARRPVQRSELEAVGLACALTASGLMGATPAEDPFECEELAQWLAYMTEGACTSEQVRQMAHDVRDDLGSSLHQPTVYTFLRRYLRQTGWTEGSFSLANYLVELAILDASFLEFRPQVVAAAAAILCRQYASQGVGVRTMPHWKSKLLRSAGVDVCKELAPCAARLTRLHAAQCQKGKHLFVHQKFTSSRVAAVAKLKANPPADASFFVCYMMAESL